MDIGLDYATDLTFMDLAYGEVSEETLTVDPTTLRFALAPAGMETTYRVDLNLSGQDGNRGLLIAQGLLNAGPAQPSRAFQLVFVTPEGNVITGVVATANEPETALPTEFAMHGNLPNPFSARTSFSFDLPQAAEVTVEVFDVMGRKVIDLQPVALGAGANQRIELDGSSLASGVYVYRLTAAGGSEVWTKAGRFTLAR